MITIDCTTIYLISCWIEIGITFFASISWDFVMENAFPKRTQTIRKNAFHFNCHFNLILKWALKFDLNFVLGTQIVDMGGSWFNEMNSSLITDSINENSLPKSTSTEYSELP